MYIDFYNGDIYSFVYQIIGDFKNSLNTLNELLYYDLGVELSPEFISNAVGNYGIVLYFATYILLGFLIFKLVSFLFNLFFAR